MFKYSKKTMAIIFMMLVMVSASVFADSDNIDIKIDGKNISFDKQTGLPYIDESNIVRVPFIATMNALGSEVHSHDDLGILYARKSHIEIGVFLGNKNHLQKDHRDIDNPNANCNIINDIVYMPLEIVLDNLNFQYSFNDNTYDITEIKPPTIDIDAPSYSNKEYEMVKILTDTDAALYIDNELISKSSDDKYKVSVDKRYEIKAVSKDGIKNYCDIWIRLSKEENFLKIKNYEQEDGHLLIKGSSKSSSKITINGKEIRNGAAWFSHQLKLEEGQNKIIIESEDAITSKVLKKSLVVNYDSSKPESPSTPPEEDNNDSSNDINQLAKLKKPILILNQEIPAKTDSTTIKISGYCENTQLLLVSAPVSGLQKIKYDYNKKNHFTIEFKIHDNNGGGNVTPEGAQSYFQIVAVNDKYSYSIGDFITYTGEY